MITEAKCKVHHYPNEIRIDSIGTLNDVHHMASRFGGTISVMMIDVGRESKNIYRMGYILRHWPFELLIYGIELTKEQYEIQIDSWNGETFKKYQPKTIVTLVDNLYFLPQ